MRVKLIHLTPALGAAAVAAAMFAAPMASAGPGPAQPHQSCVGADTATVCQSPGNVQINDAPPPVQYFPYGGLGFLI
jgi:hypothetical protein